MEFKPMPKMARLSREVVITEKIDGTNASVLVFLQPYGNEESMAEWEEARKKAVVVIPDVPTLILAGSRTRWVVPGDDNFGWAAWVKEHAEELAELGPGHHFGEYWGKGIQRGYGLAERRFSLFNTGRWVEHGYWKEGLDMVPLCCHVVPVLYRGDFSLAAVDIAMRALQDNGSVAAPGFMDPEGIVVYHTAANQLFKKTVKGDEAGKSREGQITAAPKVRAPRDPSVGGRRKGPQPITFPDRRQPK